MAEGTKAGDISIRRELLSGTTAKAVTAVVQFGGAIVFARLLGPSGYGAYYMLLAAATISIRPADGWARAATKRFSEQISEQERAEILGAQFAFLACFTVLIGVGSTVGAGSLIEYTGLSQAPAWLTLLVGTFGCYTMLFQTAHGRGNVGASIWVATLKNIVAVAVQASLILLGLEVMGMVFGHAIALAATCPLLLYFTGVRPTVPGRGTVVDLWEYARYSIPNNFLGTVYSRFDVILLGVILSPTAAGYYEAAIRISVPAIFVGSVAGSVLLPRVSNLRSTGRNPESDIRKAFSYASILGVPLFFGSVAIGREVIVMVFGGEFAPAAPLLVGLTAYQVFHANCIILTNIVGGVDRPDVSTRLSAVALAVNIILGVVLTLEFGPIGVVIATVVSELIRYVGLVRFVSGYVALSALFPRRLFEQFGSGLVMILGIELLLSVVTIQSVGMLAAVIGVGVVIYFGSLLVVSEQTRSVVFSAVAG